MSGPDTAGGTSDPVARAGEGMTVKLLERRCTRCGARMEELCNGHTGELVAIRCRGGCKPAPKTFAVPAGTKAERCRSCGQGVYWIRTAGGKSMPVERDGISHFARCHQAAAWRKGKGG